MRRSRGKSSEEAAVPTDRVGHISFVLSIEDQGTLSVGQYMMLATSSGCGSLVTCLNINHGCNPGTLLLEMVNIFMNGVPNPRLFIGTVLSLACSAVSKPCGPLRTLMFMHHL